MKARFEPLTGVIRILEPHSYSVTVRFIDSETVEFVGVTSAPKPSEYRAVLQKLRKMGVKKVKKVRYTEL